VLVVKRPLGDDDQKGEGGAAESDVEGVVDILGHEADEEGDGADEGEEAVGDVFGDALPFEVLWWGGRDRWSVDASAGASAGAEEEDWDGERTISPS
jgi:hypothetical protein